MHYEFINILTFFIFHFQKSFYYLKLFITIIFNFATKNKYNKNCF